MYLQVFVVTNSSISLKLSFVDSLSPPPQLHSRITMKTSNNFDVQPLKDTVSVGLQRDNTVAAL